MKVNYDHLDIEITGNGGHEFFYSGKLFTGVAFELDGQENVIGESTYQDGYLAGPLKLWYSNGKVESITNYLTNRKNGESKDWYISGQLHKDELYEADILIRSKEYDEAGNLVKEYDVEKDSPATYESLLEWRAYWAREAKKSEAE